MADEEIWQPREIVSPTRVGERVKGDAISSLLARGDLTRSTKLGALASLRAASVVEAFANEKLPVVGRAGAIEIAVHEVLREGANAIRLHVVATLDGNPIEGWDVDHRIVNPPLDIVRNGEVTENPVLAALDTLLDIAIRMVGAAADTREHLAKEAS